MPSSISTPIRSTASLLIIGMIALLGIVGSSIWLVERSQDYFDRLIEARQARTLAVDLLTTVQDAEIGQRGFLLTDDQKYLEPFYFARERIMPRFDDLRSFLSNYPTQKERVEALDSALEGKISELDETVSLGLAGNREAAIAIVQNDTGKQLMDEIRSALGGLVQLADVRIQERISEQRASTNLLRWFVIASVAVIILVVGGAVYIAIGYTREIVKARREVEELNTGLEGRIAERTQDLMRANEEVQRFAYIVTHDLRAPLVNIMGFTSELETTMASIQTYVMAEGETLSEQDVKDARLAASEDLPEAITFIRSSTRKMDRLINAILKISRDGQRPLKPERINLQTLLSGNADIVHHQVAETGGEIRISTNVSSIVTDRLSLEQIIGNLFDNAVKYRAPDRPIEVDVTTSRDVGRHVIIEVADNGRGISPEDHQRVFDLFRRSGKQDQAGEGIGLAHVRSLVRNLGGDITMKSEFGQGTTFRIMLPENLASVTRSKSN